MTVSSGIGVGGAVALDLNSLINSGATRFHYAILTHYDPGVVGRAKTVASASDAYNA